VITAADVQGLKSTGFKKNRQNNQLYQIQYYTWQSTLPPLSTTREIFRGQSLITTSCSEISYIFFWGGSPPLDYQEVEARGVEPLSSNRIRRPSTCLTALEI